MLEVQTDDRRKKVAVEDCLDFKETFLSTVKLYSLTLTPTSVNPEAVLNMDIASIMSPVGFSKGMP